jgi:rhodanese-related sulfurtransferase
MNAKIYGIMIALFLGGLMLFLPIEEEMTEVPGSDIKLLPGKVMISPLRLSDWIIRGTQDLLLIDIRTKVDYEKERIQGAMNIPLSELIVRTTLMRLPRHKVIVLYGYGLDKDAQALQVMRSRGFSTYLLDGGIKAWKSVVMNPEPPPEGASEKEYKEYLTTLAVSSYFKGKLYTSAGGIPGMKAATPHVSLPLIAPGAGPDEGC